MSFGSLMQYTRERWPASVTRNGSIVKALLRKWPEREVEAMVKGAHLLGWQSLVALNATEGIGRRMAMAKYWQSQNTRTAPLPERLKSILFTMSKP